MKKSITQLFKNCTFVALFSVAGSASAATYTAISSGLWSNTSIWAGGVSPGPSLGTLDNVIINAGANVMLDMDVEFSGILTSLEVNGSLQSSSSAYFLDMTGGVLLGSGSLTLHNLRFGTIASMTFSGTANVDKMWNNSLSLNLASDLVVNDSLFLDAGAMNLSTGSLTFTSGTVIRVDDGTLAASGGLLNNGNAYSVTYVGSSKNTGIELAGSGLTDVWINLDNNLQKVFIVGNVNVEGVMHHNQGMINLNGGTLTLIGDYSAVAGVFFIGSPTSNLSIQHGSSLSSVLMFDEDADVLNDLTINMVGNSATTYLGSSLTINGTLLLEDGNFSMAADTLTMQTASEIVVTDGQLVSSGGVFDGDNLYNVTYNGTLSSMSGLELTGLGLNDLSVMMDDETLAVYLSNSVVVDGALNLDNGGMELNGSDLTLDGSLQTTSDGWFGGHANSDITFNTDSLVGDTVWFSTANNTFGDITVNAADSSDLMVASNLHAENILMTAGGMHIWNNEIWLNTTGAITGANASRFVMIDGTGSLVLNVQIAAPYTMYAVGTDAGYAPVGLQQNTGTAGYFKVNSINEVWSNGLSGIDFVTDNQTVVSRTWNVQPVSAGALDMNLTAMWQDIFEVNTFDRNDSYIMRYNGVNWDASNQIGAVATPVGNMYQLERENLVSLGQFAVGAGDELNISEISPITATIYPNPVQNILNCMVVVDEPTTAKVVDITGNVLHTENVNGNHSFDFTNYPNGIYYVNYSNSKGSSSYKVIK